MTLGILTAMQKEHDQIVSLLQDRHTEGDKFTYTVGTIGSATIVLRQCGIGKVNAAVGTAELIRTYRPDCVISTGVAGGIDTCLNVMDVVVSTALVHHDFDLTSWGLGKGEIQDMPRFFYAGEQLVAAARALNSPIIHTGLIATGDQFITSRAEQQAIKQEFPDALACDMESAAIAQTCYIYSVPFVSFRIISDTPGADAHQQQYDNFWEEMANRSFHITHEYLTALIQSPL